GHSSDGAQDDRRGLGGLRDAHTAAPAPLRYAGGVGGVMQTGQVKWIGEERFVATGPSGHAVTIDSNRKSNTAMRPMEMLLMALGACTATDIVIILGKKRQKLEHLNVVCSGERAADPPQVWTKFELVYRLRGDLDDAA